MRLNPSYGLGIQYLDPNAPPPTQLPSLPGNTGGGGWWETGWGGWDLCSGPLGQWLCGGQNLPGQIPTQTQTTPIPPTGTGADNKNMGLYLGIAGGVVIIVLIIILILKK